MSRSLNFYALLCARILVGAFFVWSAIVNAFSRSAAASAFAAAHIPLSVWAVYAAIAIEGVCGAMLILGRRSQIAAVVLAAYLTLVTVLTRADFSSAAQAGLFLQNLALVGGLLYMAVYGSRK